MSHLESYQLIGLFVLGAAHGINPGMGWLFAMARGCQERTRWAVWRSLGPLAVGHGLAISAALVVASLLGALLPLALLRWLIGAGLAIRGIMLLVRHRHPRAGGMRVSAPGLAWWSFLMASAHGAGLMALPLVVGVPAKSGQVSSTHTHHIGAQMSLGPAVHAGALEATAAHAAGYLLVTGLLAIVVYEYLGLRMLRSAWINLDVLWAGALILTGAATLLG